MTELSSFRAIVELWPKQEALADEIAAPFSAVRKWAQRDSIPAEWWSALLKLPTAIEGGVTAELLARLAAREREVA